MIPEDEVIVREIAPIEEPAFVEFGIRDLREITRDERA